MTPTTTNTNSPTDWHLQLLLVSLHETSSPGMPQHPSAVLCLATYNTDTNLSQLVFLLPVLLPAFFVAGHIYLSKIVFVCKLKIKTEINF